MAEYVIMHGGNYLAGRVGWGPTFTSEQTEAKKFKSVSEAYEYRRNNLQRMNCKIAQLPCVWLPPRIIC